MDTIRKRERLIRIKKSVKAKFDLGAIVSKFEGKQAILFEKVDDSKIMVACNILGTRRRFSLAIGANDEKLIHLYVKKAIAKMAIPKKLSEKAHFYDNSSRDLMELPIVTHFEKDAGPYITSSVVFVKDQEKGSQSSSTHRLLRLDDKHMAIRMVEGRHLHKCYSFAKEHGEDLKIAVAIGMHPAVNIARAYSGCIWC